MGLLPTVKLQRLSPQDIRRIKCGLLRKSRVSSPCVVVRRLSPLDIKRCINGELCSECGKRFYQKTSYFQHLYLCKYGGTKFVGRCHFCNILFKSASAIKDHYATSHPQWGQRIQSPNSLALKCTLCPRSFKLAYGLMQHMLRDHAPDEEPQGDLESDTESVTAHTEANNTA